MQATNEFTWLLRRLGSMPWRTLLGLVCVSLESVAATIDPMLMCRLIDDSLPEHNLGLALAPAGGIGLCYFNRFALSAAGSLVNFSISQRCVRHLRRALLDQMNRLSADYHEQAPTGERLTRIEQDVDEIANLGADTVNQSIRVILFFAMNLVMIARLNLLMTLTVLPLFAIVQRLFSLRLIIRADEARAQVGVATSTLTEPFAGVPQIQFPGAEEATLQRAVSIWDGMLRAQWIQRRMQIGFSLSIGAILVVAILVILTFGSFKVLAGALTIGGLVTFYTYGARVFEPISSAMDVYARVQLVCPANLGPVVMRETGTNSLLL